MSPAGRVVAMGVVAATTAIGCRPATPTPPFTAAHRTAVIEALKAKGLDEAPRLLEVTPEGWVVATFELGDAARANRVVPLSADAMVRLHAIREALQPAGFANYRVHIHGSAPGGGLGRRYGTVQLRGDRVEWMGPE